MANTWGKQPRKEVWQDLQVLALWILIIGVVGYVLFPNFFKDIYSRLSEPVTQTSTLNTDYQPNNLTNSYLNAGSSDSQLSSNSPLLYGQDSPSVSDALYNGKSNISTGYWVIYVADGEFKQFEVSNDAYLFLLRLIESDQNASGQNTVILASNGQISKYNVSSEVYTIINNVSLIGARTNK